MTRVADQLSARRVKMRAFQHFIAGTPSLTDRLINLTFSK